MDIENVAAIVTGGGSGLGAATARALSEAGAKVTILDRNADAAEAVANQIGGMAQVCDISDGPSVEAALRYASAGHGPARVLINCAGINNPGRVVGRKGVLPLDTFASVVRVNLIGTFNTVRLFAAGAIGLPPLADGERAVIVNTASIAAFDGQIGQAAYSASKGGVVAMTLPLAREFAEHGIRINAIAPGLFETPMMTELPQEIQASLAASVPFPRRLGLPGEYAKLVLHICENAMLNGETIRLDGALRMR
jgi:NAD(P)-dependent dehydrogenase (short-subunit alcohol dehydrogenase family)